MNISAEFQLYSPYGFWGDEFSLSVAMATNQIQQLDKIHIFGRGLLKKHFCKTFVKISAGT